MSKPAEEFRATWEQEAPRLLVFARRHVGATDAADIVADTFTIAWRRWAEVPTPPTAWLFGTARHVIRNHVRSQRRRSALDQRLLLLSEVAATDHAVPLERAVALARLAELSEEQREALLLVSWDGLTTEEAATALGIRPATFRKRLQRARAALDASDTPRTVISRPALQETR